jgi:hypothetical protein
MSEKDFLGKKRSLKEILFKVEKTNETESGNKKPKMNENEIEKEFDYCLLGLIKQINKDCNNFSKLKDEDYTTILYNNFKEIKNNQDFKSEIKKVLDNPNSSYFQKFVKFIKERREILQNSEKKGLAWYKDFVNKRKKSPELYQESDYCKDNFNNLTKDEKEEIFLAGLIYLSFENMKKEEEKFDTSINQENCDNKENAIKIELQNFNLKESSTLVLISGIKFVTHIIELNFSGNELTPKACFWIGTFFKYNRHNVKLLSLERCSLTNLCLYMFVIGATFSSDNLNEEKIYLEKLILKDNDNIKDENIFNEYPLSLIMEKFLIKNLNLYNTKIGNNGLKKLCETFLKLLNNQNGNEKFFILKTLNLYNINLKNEESLDLLGDVLIHKQSTIEILILTKNLITSPQSQNLGNTPIPIFFKKFMGKIAESKTLKELLLLKCEIGKNKNDIEILCQMLEKNKTLESLRMFDNLINDEEAFLKILKLFSEYKNELKNKTLKSLDLSKNHCNIKVSEDFLNLIEKLNLEYLDINQNTMDEKEKEIFRKRTNALEKIKIVY